METAEPAALVSLASCELVGQEGESGQEALNISFHLGRLEILWFHKDIHFGRRIVFDGFKLWENKNPR